MIKKKVQIMPDANEALANALWKIYRRSGRPVAWTDDGNLPWNEPDFSERMLREHLDQSHGAASRKTEERALQIDWLWDKLGLEPSTALLDVTCGPGLYATAFAQRGCKVTGIDFSPASIAHARKLALTEQVTDKCQFIEQDVRQMPTFDTQFDAAILIYGQLAVFQKQEAQAILAHIAQSLKPGSKLCVELLDQETVDKSESTWWFTDNTGLWGDKPFLHLGERFWDAEEALSIERFQTIDLETGKHSEVNLCDQTYATADMAAMMKNAGFGSVETYPAWDSVPLYDAPEWVVYVAER